VGAFLWFFFRFSLNIGKGMGFRVSAASALRFGRLGKCLNEEEEKKIIGERSAHRVEEKER
jgi:hypothetical protein